MIFMLLVTLLALALAAVSVIAAWAAQSWLILFAGLGCAWIAFSLGLYSTMPGRPRRFGER